MIYEYLLDLRAYVPLEEEVKLVGDGEIRLCWGSDEYDALTKYIRKYLGEPNESNQDVIFKLSRLRPTGRFQYYPYKKDLSYFEYKGRPYINELINGFMGASMGAGTEKELNTYRRKLETFIDKYNQDIPEEIVTKLEEQYNKSLEEIKLGRKKSLQYYPTINNNEPYDPYTIVFDYSKQIAQILKRFGFRVRLLNNRFEVTMPMYYENYWFTNIKEEITSLTPVELILYWEENHEDWLFPSDKRFYGLDKIDCRTLSLLGKIDSEVGIVNINRELEKNKVTPFVYKNQEGSYVIHVLKEEAIKAKEILNSINNKLRGFINFLDWVGGEADEDECAFVKTEDFYR